MIKTLLKVKKIDVVIHLASITNSGEFFNRKILI